MKTMSRKLSLALAGVFASAAIGSTALAATQTECSLVGSWFGGDAGGDLVWLGVHTPGSRDGVGDMVLNWVTNNMIPPPMRMTSGHGVWEQTRKGVYDYTWYAMAVDDTTGKTYPVVVNGVATNQDCNSVVIRYRFRIYEDGQVIYVTPSETSEPGYAYETRLPLVKAP